MEMQEIIGKEDGMCEESKRVLETSVEKYGSTVSSKQRSASENIYSETSPGQQPTTDTPVEEAESTIYSKLTSPSEDIYAGASADADRPDLKVQSNVGVYRSFCLVLSLICLVLLMVIIALCVKLQSQPPVCHETEKRIEAEEEGGDVNSERNDGKEGGSQSSQVCSLQKCQAQYSEQLSPDCNKCEVGWLYFESTCYFLSKNRMTWNGSRDECQRRGGDLVVISNQRVQTFLTEKGNVVYWIGLRQRTGTWFWVNNTALGHSYWSESIGQNKCGSITGRDPPERSWNSSPCYVYTFYICQKGANGQTTTPGSGL